MLWPSFSEIMTTATGAFPAGQVAASFMFACILSAAQSVQCLQMSGELVRQAQHGERWVGGACAREHASAG